MQTSRMNGVLIITSMYLKFFLKKLDSLVASAHDVIIFSV